MIGREISHYKILEKIGEGGMGVVYKAQDTKLDRTVALKFLPEHLLYDPASKARFIDEAKGASAINHQNITTVYDIDEFEGKSFIAMEYIEGKSLKELAKGELKLNQVFEIVIQIAKGLNAAHKKEIVHRDIKPDNIMVTKDNVVKIMDFGLAKLKGYSHLTKVGTTVGTMAYMSPEQAQGEEIDHRTDIFSLGVVLYELITGRLPFRGEHEAAIIYSICNEEAEPLARYKTSIPLELERIVEKALKKDRTVRYQSAADLEADLKGVQKEITSGIAPFRQRIRNHKVLVIGMVALILIVGYIIFSRFFGPSSKEPASQRKMLAVLPFENLGSPEQEYFADGITEEIMARLANIQGLGVIARTSVLQYKNSKKTIPEIGKELNVDYVLEGTIRWQKSSEGESRVRVTPQLIRVSDATHLWANVYDEVMAEVFKVQSDIAQKVASAMGVALLEQERQSLEAKPTENIDAYEYYLRGNDYFNRSLTEKKGLQIAREMYKKAVELDPNFAMAYARLAMSQIELYWHHEKIEELLIQAKKAIDKSFQLQPGLPEAHLALGSYYYHALDYDQALEQFTIAQKGLTNNSDLLMEIGYVKRRQGKWEQAIASFNKATELDPGNRAIPSVIGLTYSRMRNYLEAERYYDRAISLAPDWSEPYIRKVSTYILWEGNTEKARKVLEEAERKVQSSELAVAWVTLDILDGNYQRALGRLTGMDVFANDPTLSGDVAASYFLTKARLYKLTNQPQLERACYDSARVILETKLQTSPDYALHSQLGIAYGGLGRKEEAIREGRKAVEMLPVSKHAFEGVNLAENLARIYVMIGGYNAAIEQLEYLLTIPSQISIPLLRIDPTWAPLRNHPRFQKLLAGSK